MASTCSGSYIISRAKFLIFLNVTLLLAIKSCVTGSVDLSYHRPPSSRETSCEGSKNTNVISGEYDTSPRNPKGNLERAAKASIFWANDCWTWSSKIHGPQLKAISQPEGIAWKEQTVLDFEWQTEVKFWVGDFEFQVATSREETQTSMSDETLCW